MRTNAAPKPKSGGTLPKGNWSSKLDKGIRGTSGTTKITFKKTANKSRAKSGC